MLLLLLLLLLLLVFLVVAAALPLGGRFAVVGGRNSDWAANAWLSHNNGEVFDVVCSEWKRLPTVMAGGAREDAMLVPMGDLFIHL